MREWRGESTAYSVYSLGEIEAKKQSWAEANAYYQRVYVGYQKFLPWVAKAYIRSGECFEKLKSRRKRRTPTANCCETKSSRFFQAQTGGHSSHGGTGMKLPLSVPPPRRF